MSKFEHEISNKLFTDPGELSNVDRWHQPSSTWNTAALNVRQADPFCCLTSWQLSFHEAFSPRRRLLIKESSDSAIAFAEKVFSSRSVFLTPIECMWFFGNPLLGSHPVDLLAETLSDIEQLYHPIFPTIMISGLVPNGSLIQKLRKRLGYKFKFSLHGLELQCAASLSGGVDGFLSRRSGNHRRKLKKQIKRAAENGVYFERHSPSSNSEVEEIYSRMISIELASWKGSGKCGMAEPRPKKFYNIMMKRLALSKNARIILARHEGKDIGYIFGGMAGKVYRGQQFSFDDQWRSASIGNILQFEQIKWLCEEASTRYDMGPLNGHKMEYKRHWTERKHSIETWGLTKK
jgi:hypothetical protein